MNTFLSLLFGVVILLIPSNLGERIRYDNYKLVRFTPTDETELDLLNQLQRQNFGLIFWTEPSHVGKSVDIMFPPHLQGDTFDFLRKRLTNSHVMSHNVQTLLDKEVDNGGLPNRRMQLDWDHYGSLEEINDYLQAQTVVHGIAELQLIGTSYKDRVIQLVKISKPSSTQKPAIWMDGGIHAREWISPAVVTYVLDQLLNNERDTELGKITEDFDLYIVPVLNPDGYVYSQTANRLWLKTRSRTESIFGCRGANGNLNWGYEFNAGGPFDDPCSDLYHGGFPFSQPEVNATAEYFNGIGDQVKMFLSMHSYCQLILFPWAYANVSFPEYEPWMKIGEAAAQAIKGVHGMEFRVAVANIAREFEPFGGSSLDWVMGVHNTSLVFGVELRDIEEHGFLLPPEQIKPSREEFLEGFKELVNQLRSRLGMS